MFSYTKADLAALATPRGSEACVVGEAGDRVVELCGRAAGGHVALLKPRILAGAAWLGGPCRGQCCHGKGKENHSLLADAHAHFRRSLLAHFVRRSGQH